MGLPVLLKPRLLCLGFLLLTGCATVDSYRVSMVGSHHERSCSFEGAQVLGARDAKAHRPMQRQVAALCEASVRAAVRRGYRIGYGQQKRQMMTRSQNAILAKKSPRKGYQCFTGPNRTQICGYNCRHRYDHWVCEESV